VSRTTIDHGERPHSLLGASSASRWFECPGSVNLHRKLGDLVPESKYAAEGTMAHELAEHCIEQCEDPMDMIGDYLNKNETPITRDMAEAVKVYCDYVEELLGKGPEKGILYIEESFRLDWIDKECYGTNDLCLLIPFKKLTVIDYKHGKGVPVEPEYNKQLMYYALGAAKDAEVDVVEMVIVQPRNDHPEGPIRSWEVPWTELEKFEKDLKIAIKKTRDPNAPLVSGDHCRWCPVKPQCPALRNKAFEVAQQKFDVIEDVEVMELPKQGELSPEQVSKVLQAADMINEWVKSLHVYAKTQMDQGKTVPGFKLVRKRTHRKWDNEANVESEFKDLFGDEIYSPRKLRTPKQLESIVGKEEVNKFSSTPVGEITIAPESDKRQAIKPAIELFDNIEEMDI
jgi:hypothetical protein